MTNETQNTTATMTSENTLAHIELQPFIGGDHTAPLIDGMPEFLKPTRIAQVHKVPLDPNPAPLPDWLSAPEPVYTPSKQNREAVASWLHEQYKAVLPRVLERICSGATLTSVLTDDYRDIDPGAFMRWVKKNPQYHELYKEAKEVRTESWVGRIVTHAEGTATMDDVQRSKLIVDTYKWLIECDDRKSYGKTQQINVAGSISITDALKQAQSRVIEGTFREISE